MRKKKRYFLSDFIKKSKIKNNLIDFLIAAYVNTGIKCNVFFEGLRILFHCTASELLS